MTVACNPVAHDGNGGLRSRKRRHRIDVKKGAKLIVSDPMQLSEGENVALLEICGTYHPSYCRREPLEPPPLSPLLGSIMKLTTARLVELPQDLVSVV